MIGSSRNEEKRIDFIRLYRFVFEPSDTLSHEIWINT